ncbi:MAG: bifunctional alpha/beta hydrolase/OsmC family protein [Burkholderiales bacterium]
MSKTSKQVKFPGASGEMLAARLDLPDGTPVAYALFAHCFTCSKDTRASAYISDALAEAGIAVLRFDFTGLGSSEGEFANTNFSSNVDDLVAAADFLREAYRAPGLLVGHSLGGAAVLAAAPRIDEAVAVATINAPSDPSHVLHLFKDSVETIERRGEAEVELAGRRFRITRQFIEDVSGSKLTDALGRLRRALMVFHAPQDTAVSIDNAASIFTAAKHPKSFVSLDDADHLLTRKQDALYVGAVLAAWATRYLGGKPAADVAVTAAAEGVVVEEAGQGRLAQIVRAGNHVLHADEPESLGGNDSGPSPYQLLSAALGACTSMTLRMYADQKKWPLEKVSVRLKHDKIHAKDCAECETREGRIDRIDREIEITGDLDDTQRQRLLEIADRCPVHRTLHAEVSVRSKLV